ncbi:MAG: DUF6798 domain-containing protein [Pseudomonadota bacterium]
MTETQAPTAFERFSQSPVATVVSALLIVGVLTLHTFPLYWTANEIYYFELSRFNFDSSGFGEFHSISGGSYARFLPFFALGLIQELIGREAAFVLMRLVLLGTYAAAFIALSRALGLHFLVMPIALIIFVFLGEEFFSGSYLFGSTESKGFSYAVVIFGIAAMLRGKALSSALIMALATYFHFLIGGFWFGGALLLGLLLRQRIMELAKATGVFVLIVSPLVIALVSEQLLSAAPDMSDLGASINDIYASRNIHHVLPFLNLGGFAFSWFPGVVLLAATGCALAMLWFMDRDGPISVIYPWLLLLHVYLLVALGLAALDRETNFLVPFYIFRPNSLVLLFSVIAILAATIRLSRASSVALPVLLLIFGALIVGERVPVMAKSLLEDRANLWRLDASANADERAAMAWIEQETARDAVVVFEGTPHTDWNPPWMALEAITGRPSLVVYKFVPVTKPTLAEWYRRVLWRDAVFGGACARLADYPVSFLVTLSVESRERMSRCGDVTFQSGPVAIVDVRQRTGQ